MLLYSDCFNDLNKFNFTLLLQILSVVQYFQYFIILSKYGGHLKICGS